METGIHELTAGYALDALDPDERREYEAHLADCQHCREELASLAQTTEALAIAASGPAPPPGLRDRILEGARAEAQVVVPFEPRRRRTVPVLAAAAAMAAVVALAVGLWAERLSGDLDDARSALERARAAAAVLADPEARTVALQAGDGRLVVGPEGEAVLVLDGMDPAPAGKTYELWIIEGDTPQRAGLFPGRDGTDVVPVDGTVAEGDIVAVTIEDAAGVDAPTTTPIVASNPV
ncbi:MAG TPA: anti-sigma factor [Gaiellaceae bacterium]